MNEFVEWLLWALAIFAVLLLCEWALRRRMET